MTANDPLETVLPVATNLDELEDIKVKEETLHEKLEDDDGDFMDEVNCESSIDASDIEEECSKDKKTSKKGNKKIAKIKILKKVICTFLDLQKKNPN